MVSSFVMAPPATLIAPLARVTVVSTADVVLFALAIGVAVGAALLVGRFVGAARARSSLRVVARPSHVTTRSAA